MLSTMDSLKESIKGTIELEKDGTITVIDIRRFEAQLIDTLIYSAVLDANQEIKKTCQ